MDDFGTYPTSALRQASSTERKGRRPATSDSKALDALKAAGSGGLSSGVWRECSGLRPSTFKDARARLEKRGEATRMGERWVAVELAASETNGNNIIGELKG